MFLFAFLLQVQAPHVDAMDMSFTLKDVIYILCLVLPIAGMLFRQTANNKALTIRAKNNELKNKEENVIIHDRINKTQEDMKEYHRKSDAEFKEINKNLNTIIALVTKKP